MVQNYVVMRPYSSPLSRWFNGTMSFLAYTMLQGVLKVGLPCLRKLNQIWLPISPIAAELEFASRGKECDSSVAGSHDDMHLTDCELNNSTAVLSKNLPDNTCEESRKTSSILLKKVVGSCVSVGSSYEAENEDARCCIKTDFRATYRSTSPSLLNPSCKHHSGEVCNFPLPISVTKSDCIALSSTDYSSMANAIGEQSEAFAKCLEEDKMAFLKSDYETNQQKFGRSLPTIGTEPNRLVVQLIRLCHGLHICLYFGSLVDMNVPRSRKQCGIVTNSLLTGFSAIVKMLHVMNKGHLAKKGGER